MYSGGPVFPRLAGISLLFQKERWTCFAAGAPLSQLCRLAERVGIFQLCFLQNLFCGWKRLKVSVQAVIGAYGGEEETDRSVRSLLISLTDIVLIGAALPPLSVSPPPDTAPLRDFTHSLVGRSRTAVVLNSTAGSVGPSRLDEKSRCSLCSYLLRSKKTEEVEERAVLGRRVL